MVQSTHIGVLHEQTTEGTLDYVALDKMSHYPYLFKLSSQYTLPSVFTVNWNLPMEAIWS